MVGVDEKKGELMGIRQQNELDQSAGFGSAINPGEKEDTKQLLFHSVEKWAGRKPDAEALVYENFRLSYRQLHEETDLLAKAMLEVGVDKGDRVATLSMARIEFITTYLAASKIGAVWLGLNPKSTLEELRYLLADSQPKILITIRYFLGNDLAETIMALKKEMPFLKKVLVLGDPFEGAEKFEPFVKQSRLHLDAELQHRKKNVFPQDSVLLAYTSGSTGKPKGVVHTHGSIVASAEGEAKCLDFSENSRILLHFPINHLAAAVEIGFTTIFAGGSILLMHQFDPSASLRAIEQERITILGQVPVMFLMQFQDPVYKEVDLSSLKTIIWSGAAAGENLLSNLQEISRKTGAKLATGYGSTETGGFVTFTGPDDSYQLLAKSVGRPVSHACLKIVDYQRNPVQQGEIGEIAVRGSSTFKEYLNKPEATAKVLDSDGWYYTDDLGYCDPDGYYFITGRKSEMFKTGGENVYPREIEEVLEKHPAVLLAAVIGVADDIYQEVGWAYLTLKPGRQTNESEMRTLCKANLSNFKVPKRFIFRDDIPLLPNGKVNKKALRTLG